MARERTPNFVTLSEAARRIGEPMTFVKGLAMGRGIQFLELGTSLVMRGADFLQLENFLASRPIPRSGRGKARRAAAEA